MAHIKILTTLGALSLIGACSTGEASDPTATCTALLAGDPEVEGDLTEVGASVESYCACYATNLETLGDEAQTTVLKVSQIIADIRAERGVDVEDAASLIEVDVEDTDAASFAVTQAELETTGRFGDGVRRTMRDNDGQCAPVDMR